MSWADWARFIDIEDRKSAEIMLARAAEPSSGTSIRSKKVPSATCDISTLDQALPIAA
jgi:hypothetical protein